LDFAPVNLSNKKTKNEDKSFIDQGWQSSCFWGKKISMKWLYSEPLKKTFLNKMACFNVLVTN